jgi:hypothetical protein
VPHKAAHAQLVKGVRALRQPQMRPLPVALMAAWTGGKRTAVEAQSGGMLCPPPLLWARYVAIRCLLPQNTLLHP